MTLNFIDKARADLKLRKYEYGKLDRKGLMDMAAAAILRKAQSLTWASKKVETDDRKGECGIPHSPLILETIHFLLDSFTTNSIVSGSYVT